MRLVRYDWAYRITALLGCPHCNLHAVNGLYKRHSEDQSCCQVRAVAALPAVKDNTDSGYFQTAKLIGDKRATVAEKFFGRPFKRVMVTDAGVMSQ